MAATIKYNGKSIATINKGQTATLHCADKKMLTDILVEYPGVTVGNLTGTTWLIPRGWLCEAGLGKFRVEGELRWITETGNKGVTDFDFLHLGYKSDDEMANYLTTDSKPVNGMSGGYVLDNSVEIWQLVIEGGEDVANSTLIGWLKSNGAKEVGGAPTTITYHGTETEIPAGQTATMTCTGKKMLSDVVVTV